jgi:predicted nucleic acid-binding protein
VGESPALFVSTVTVQEMMVRAHIVSEVERTREFLLTFTPLEFSEDCALKAAALAAAIGRPARRKPKSKDREDVELWQRDAAIAGTAAARKVDLLLTRDGGFNRFRELVDYRIVVVT